MLVNLAVDKLISNSFFAPKLLIYKEITTRSLVDNLVDNKTWPNSSNYHCSIRQPGTCSLTLVRALHSF